MLTYYAKGRFFDQKNDAKAHNRALGIKADEVLKIVIDDRYQLTDFLNAMMAGQGRPPEAEAASQGVPAPAITEDDLTFIPDFVKHDWEQRARFARMRTE